MKVDLHIHSTYSDSSRSPEETGDIPAHAWPERHSVRGTHNHRNCFVNVGGNAIRALFVKKKRRFRCIFSLSAGGFRRLPPEKL